MLSTKPDKRLFLDKTPAYALVLDFIARIYPYAKFVVLTRHPLAVFSSYAESFFNGDYAAAQAYNPILERYVPGAGEVPAPAARRRSTTSSTNSSSPTPNAFSARSSRSSACPIEPQAVEYGRKSSTRQGPRRSDRRGAAPRPDDRVGREMGGRDRRRTRPPPALQGDHRATRSQRSRHCGGIRSTACGQPLEAAGAGGKTWRAKDLRPLPYAALAHR